MLIFSLQIFLFISLCRWTAPAKWEVSFSLTLRTELGSLFLFENSQENPSSPHTRDKKKIKKYVKEHDKNNNKLNINTSIIKLQAFIPNIQE